MQIHFFPCQMLRSDVSNFSLFTAASMMDFTTGARIYHETVEPQQVPNFRQGEHGERRSCRESKCCLVAHVTPKLP